jgi:polysaccharide export outer membrane protein
MNRITKFGLLLLIATQAQLALAQGDGSKGNPPETKNNAPKGNGGQATPKSATDDPTYVIGPGDEIYVSVWDQPDLTRSVPVRPDGMISLPLLNDVAASGKTPMQLSTLITGKLTSLVKDPRVTVIVTATNSQRVFVLGKVARAGAYPMIPGMTVLQAISSAGGLAMFASEKKITILRTENGQQLRIPFNYKEVINGIRPEQNILVKPGDTIVVP